MKIMKEMLNKIGDKMIRTGHNPNLELLEQAPSIIRYLVGRVEELEKEIESCVAHANDFSADCRHEKCSKENLERERLHLQSYIQTLLSKVATDMSPDWQEGYNEALKHILGRMNGEPEKVQSELQRLQDENTRLGLQIQPLAEQIKMLEYKVNVVEGRYAKVMEQLAKYEGAMKAALK